MDVQNEIRKQRKRTGLSQAKFGEKFSIPPHTLELWEMGVRKPKEYLVKMIKTILDYEERYGKLDDED